MCCSGALEANIHVRTPSSISNSTILQMRVHNTTCTVHTADAAIRTHNLSRWLWQWECVSVMCMQRSMKTDKAECADAHCGSCIAAVLTCMWRESARQHFLWCRQLSDVK